MEIISEEIEKYIIDNVNAERKMEQTKGKTQTNLEEDPHQYIQMNVVSFYCQYLSKFIINVETFKFAEKYNSNKHYSGTTTI
jgi:hypothetical protein